MDVQRDKTNGTTTISEEELLWSYMEGGVPPCVHAELTSKFYENCLLEREKEGCFSISLKSQRLKHW